MPLNLTHGLRLEAAQTLLEQLRKGMKEGESKDNDAVMLLQYALNVLGFLPEQVADDGDYGYAVYLFSLSMLFLSSFSS